MRILMFGWEFPPNISGGLGTACYGLTKSLSSLDDMDITFVIPKVQGNEKRSKIKLYGANEVDLIESKIHHEKLTIPMECYGIESFLVPYANPEEYHQLTSTSIEQIKSKVIPKGAEKKLFSGQYGPNLMTEIHNFSVIGEYISSQKKFDLIHAHDWLTFPAGIAAKKKSGKPLVVHVHATDFDRSGGKINPKVYQIEKEGMEEADCIVCVSNRTKEMVIDKYKISPRKVRTVHNGVDFTNHTQPKFAKTNSTEKIVTFLGRITLQKGPEYFVQVAELVLCRMKNVRFIMAGSGDLYHDIIKRVARTKIANRFLFTGFLKGNEVCRMLQLSDIFIMPSISEPFGICPLEAMQSGIPTIISKQSGVSEVIKHTIKVDFWDVHAMADAIHGILTYPALSRMMAVNGKQESLAIKWDDAASKLQHIYKGLYRA